MRLGSVHEGDIVDCDARGDAFLALVAKVGAGELEVRPIANGHGRVRLVRARQVRGHWRRTGRRRQDDGDARV